MRYKITFSFAVFSECPLKTVPILGILSNALTGKVSNVHYLVIFQENAPQKNRNNNLNLMGGIQDDSMTIVL